MPVTMREVARQAGVSIKTVSRVVNEQGEISEDTRQRVLAAISELGYQPNRIAQAMVTQRTRTIGFIIPDITNPFFSEVARGVQDLARDRNYNVFFCNTDDNPIEELHMLRSLATQSVDGLITFPSISDEELKNFADNYPSIVSINRFFEHPGVSLIMADNYRGAKLAVDHLVEQGHTAIAMLSGQFPSPDKIRRVKGFKDALTAHGLPVIDEWIVSGFPILTTGYEATLQLLTQYPQISAIFAYNDLLAVGAIRACKELGRRIPDDCAIVGFDDIQLAALVTPTLSSVRVDKYALGQQAVARLLEMINDSNRAFPPLEIEVELIIRESSVRDSNSEV